MVKVCDAIMGSGKSSAAITYLNEHPNEKFIYITPYLDEASRIKENCPNLHFIEPSGKLKEFRFKKYLHTAKLIEDGRNITTTHQAFKNYTKTMLDNIKKQEYTLVIDENVDILESCEIHPSDLQIALNEGYLAYKDGEYSIINDNYDGTAFKELFRTLKSRDLIKFDGEENSYYYWTLPQQLLTSFRNIFILTYMFQGQSLCYLLKMCNIPYEYISVEKDEHDVYRFGNGAGYTPDYLYRLKDLIHILEHERMNSVGKEPNALSMNWLQKKDDRVDKLKKNIYNFFNNIHRNDPPDGRLWGTYGCGYGKLRGKGYTKSYLIFNTKATNQYRNKKYLVYAANIFMNVGEKLFYKKHGVEADEDAYALSVMIQWIWRSAIRDGKEIYLYIPSKRMRTLLVDWIEKISKGGNFIEP